MRTKERWINYSAPALLYPPSSVRLEILLPFVLPLALACATGGGASDEGDDRPDASTIRADAAPTVDAAVPIDAAGADAPNPLAIDCAEDATISCGELAEHSLFFADGTLTGYSCEVEDTSGVENVYRFVPPTTGTVTINLNVLDDDPLFGDDFDLYVLENVCSLSSCATQAAAAGDESLSFTATGGTTYYIVVEAFQEGLLTFLDYDLQIVCQ